MSASLAARRRQASHCLENPEKIGQTRTVPAQRRGIPIFRSIGPFEDVAPPPDGPANLCAVGTHLSSHRLASQNWWRPHASHVPGVGVVLELSLEVVIKHRLAAID